MKNNEKTMKIMKNNESTMSCRGEGNDALPAEAGDSIFNYQNLVIHLIRAKVRTSLLEPIRSCLARIVSALIWHCPARHGIGGRCWALGGVGWALGGVVRGVPPSAIWPSKRKVTVFFSWF